MKKLAYLLCVVIAIYSCNKPDNPSPKSSTNSNQNDTNSLDISFHTVYTSSGHNAGVIYNYMYDSTTHQPIQQEFSYDSSTVSVNKHDIIVLEYDIIVSYPNGQPKFLNNDSAEVILNLGSKTLICTWDTCSHYTYVINGNTYNGTHQHEFIINMPSESAIQWNNFVLTSH